MKFPKHTLLATILAGLAAACLTLAIPAIRTTAAAVSAEGDLPRITVSGHVYDGAAGDTAHPFGGHAVALVSDSVHYATRTEADGSFSFNEVSVPVGLPIRLLAESCDGCTYSEPTVSRGSRVPMSKLPLELSFPGCVTKEGCSYPNVDFFIQRPNQQESKAVTLARAKTNVTNFSQPLALAGTPLPAASPASIVDVTAVTGQQIVGPVASWQTKDGIYNVEHLAGKNTVGDLIVFYWSPRTGEWQSVNVSQKTGYKITGLVTSWITSDGIYTVEHLAGRSVWGDLIVFYWSPLNDWRAVNVSQKTGQRILDSVTSWQTPNGIYNVEHLAGINPFGDLLVFYWSPAQDWQVVNVSQKTGRKAAATPASWQVRTDGVLTEYLAAVGYDDSLTVFSWAPGRDWNATNISQITGQQIIGAVTAWQTGNVQHLAGTGPDNSLITFWRTPTINWSAVNVTRITGEKVAGEPTVYQLKDGTENVEVLGAKSPDGHLLVFWWKPSRDWQSFDLSEVARRNIAAVPAGWLTTNGTVEHLAAQGTDRHLLVFWGFAQPRQLTDALGALLPRSSGCATSGARC